MTIFGVVGGIGSGKTMTLAYLGMNDLNSGKKIFSNVTFIKVPPNLNKNITYLTAENLATIFQDVKDKKINMENSTVVIQEMHNYIDSRRSVSNKSLLITYWILQSRHTGKGSCDIIYDTQRISQVDIRLRTNTDFILEPEIVEKNTNGEPVTIKVKITGMVGQSIIEQYFSFSCKEIMNKYDTHQLVEF